MDGMSYCFHGSGTTTGDGKFVAASVEVVFRQGNNVVCVPQSPPQLIVRRDGTLMFGVGYAEKGLNLNLKNRGNETETARLLNHGNGYHNITNLKLVLHCFDRA